MPSIEEILARLHELANTWRIAAIIWHFLFSAFIAALIAGARPSRRICGILLSLPFVSVSSIAWMSDNPFNGILFGVLSVVLIVVASRQSKEAVQIAPIWALFAGSGMIAVGWIYPHFLDTDNVLAYLYAAPTGLVPCATLSILIGFCLVLNRLNSGAYALILGITGIFFGITGVAQLNVSLDWALLLGAVILVVFALVKGNKSNSRACEHKDIRISVWGVGPRMVLFCLPNLALAILVHIMEPELTITPSPIHAISLIGAFLIVVGICLWAPGARRIDRAFHKGELLTDGVYSIVRHPMYSGIIVFIIPGIAFLLNFWSLMTVSFVAYIVFRLLIKDEDIFLEQKFGESFLEYKLKVNALIPYVSFHKQPNSLTKEFWCWEIRNKHSEESFDKCR